MKIWGDVHFPIFSEDLGIIFGYFTIEVGISGICGIAISQLWDFKFYIFSKTKIINLYFLKSQEIIIIQIYFAVFYVFAYKKKNNFKPYLFFN